MTNKDLDAMIAKVDRLLAYMDSPEHAEEIELAADKFFLKRYSRTYRADEPTPVDLPHAEKNGDSSHKPPDTLDKLRRDFPSLFGKEIP